MGTGTAGAGVRPTIAALRTETPCTHPALLGRGVGGGGGGGSGQWGNGLGQWWDEARGLRPGSVTRVNEGRSPVEELQGSRLELQGSRLESRRVIYNASRNWIVKLKGELSLLIHLLGSPFKRKRDLLHFLLNECFLLGG